MSDEQSNFNLLSDSDVSKVLDGSWQNVSFGTKKVEFGTPYALSVAYDSSADGLWFQTRFNYLSTDGKILSLSDTPVIKCTKGKHVATATIPSFDRPDDFAKAVLMVQAGGISGKGTIEISRPMLVEGTEPAAWAPAEGETLAGGGAQMSANLLDGAEAIAQDGSTYTGSVWSVPANNTSKDKNAAKVTPTGTEAVSGNQTLHVGLSVRAASGASVVVAPGVAYVDGAGNVNYVGTRVSARGTGAWQRVEGSFVIPSGMRVSFLFVHQGAGGAALELTAPCLSYGSPVCLASSAHTPYATQDHVSVTYATKASLKVTDDSIKAEVSARAQTDQMVSDLSSRLTQTANSLTSEISDRRSAITTVTGLANAAQSTADAAQSKADEASAAVSTAQSSANTAAQAAAAAQSTADTAKEDAATAQTAAEAAQSTADAAKSSASNAVETANSASSSAANAVETANSASSAASSASTAAGKASTDAAAAVKTANTASSTASSAVTTANEAAATANAASDTATAAQTMATENQSSIKQLSNSITSEVTQRTKTDQMVSDLSSRLTQTADGFSASIDRLSDTDRKVNSWFGFGSDSSGNPQLTMGSSTSPVVGVYTNAGLAYKARSGATLLELDGASRSSTMPHVHADDVSMGSWQWMPTQGGTHFTLMWIGG